MKSPAQTNLTELRLFEIAVVAVFDLGGTTRSIDTEDIAIRCHELAAEPFSWRKHPGQVNLELVRVCLSDAKKVKNGALLSGTGRDGWRLTRKGLAWIDVAGSALPKGPGAVARRSGGSIDTVRRNREVNRLESSRAWCSWKSGQGITAEDARSLFRIDSYVNEQMVEIKVTRLLSLFETGSEHQVFLAAAAKSLESDGGSDA